MRASLGEIKNRLNHQKERLLTCSEVQGMARILALMIVRNEDWIIERTLKTLSAFCDHIIVADHYSTDNTKEILKKYSPQVIAIEPQDRKFSTRIRWNLLDVARDFQGNNFIFVPDSDEIFTANILEPEILVELTKMKPGTGIELQYIHLWRSPVRWRNDESVWGPEHFWKARGFRDDRQMRYPPNTHPLDHNSSIPACRLTVRYEKVKILHYQFMLFERMRAKQRWYRATEAYEMGASQAERINQYYVITRDERQALLEPIRPEWTAGWQARGVDLENFSEKPLYWYDIEVLRCFKEKGPDYFAAIDLWDVNWEEKRQLAKARGYEEIPDEPIVDPRSLEQRLYHAYIAKFFHSPPWRDPLGMLRIMDRRFRKTARALGLRRSHLARIGVLKPKAMEKSTQQ
jgi:glycosyltransferase involved in cell wall biosynthesis